MGGGFRKMMVQPRYLQPLRSASSPSLGAAASSALRSDTGSALSLKTGSTFLDGASMGVQPPTAIKDTEQNKAHHAASDGLLLRKKTPLRRFGESKGLAISRTGVWKL